jgi:ribosomal protein L37E
MKCPLCGREAVLSYQTGRMMCSSCGWGAEHVDAEMARKQHIRRARSSRQDVTMLIVTWLVAGGLERWKLQWLILLYPGRIIGSAVVGLFRLIFSSRKPKRPPFERPR